MSRLFWVLMGALVCGSSSARAQGTSTLFFDNFNSYASGSALAGQGGWYQDPGATAPLILSTGTPLGGVAIDGLIRTGTGQYNGTSVAAARHALSGPLNPNGITTLSANAYAFSAYMSHDSGISLTSVDNSFSLAAIASWYPSLSPAWQFEGSASDYFYGAFDQPVVLQLIIDGGAGEYYYRLTYSGGTFETPHHGITPSQIAQLTVVTVFEDYRDVYLGIDIDNVSVTTTGCQVNACGSGVTDNCVTVSGTGIGGTEIFATLVPPSGATLQAAAQACGFDQGFNFVQTVTVDPYPPSSALTGGVLTIPYQDPPDGGYQGRPTTAGRWPFYYSAAQLATGRVPLGGQSPSLYGGTAFVCSDGVLVFPCVPVETPTSLTFWDAPAEDQLVPPQFLAFETNLVGVSLESGDGRTPCSGSPQYWCTTLFSFTWTDDFNGTVLGGSARSNSLPVDPGTGTGGITITGINGIRLPPVVPPNQVAIKASGLAYSRVSQTFNGTVTIKNISRSAISGPLQIVFFGMPPRVTLVNATNNLSGMPYLTVPAVGSLAPGLSVSVSVEFKNPSNVILNITPVIYSGSIN